MLTASRQLSDAEKLRKVIMELIDTERTYVKVRHISFLENFIKKLLFCRYNVYSFKIMWKVCTKCVLLHLTQKIFTGALNSENDHWTPCQALICYKNRLGRSFFLKRRLSLCAFKFNFICSCLVLILQNA